MITGSHNPADYNGFKMVLRGTAFFGDDIQQLGRMAAAGDWERGQRRRSATRGHGPLCRPAARRASTAAPSGSAGTRATAPPGRRSRSWSTQLPGEHHLLYTEVDSRFPNHHPDPTEEANLADLKALVAEKGLDFGIAFDGDGDRIGAVDGEGRVVWGDQLLAILAEPVLAELPGATIIADVKASQALFDRVAELGGKPLMWKTGHSLIKSKMKETGAPLAGEMSGHIFFAHDYYGFDDALYAAVRLIRAVTQLGGSLTALRDRDAGGGQHARAALPGRREPQVRGGRRGARPARRRGRGGRPHRRRPGQHAPTAGGCCAPRTPRTCSSPAPRRRTRPGSTAWSPRSTSSSLCPASTRGPQAGH